MNVCVVIQARMRATRLPGKMLMDVVGQPMIWHVVERLRRSRETDKIILAVPDTEDDKALEVFARENSVPCIKGDEENVLARYHKAIQAHKCEIVVRIAADRPFIDPAMIDDVIGTHLEGEADYTANNIIKTFPLGLDVEAFNRQVLERAYQAAHESYEREHVSPYIYEHPDMFILKNIEAKGKMRRPELRFTVDTAEDLAFTRAVYGELYHKNNAFTAEDVVDLLNRRPDLVEINSKIRQKKLRE